MKIKNEKLKYVPFPLGLILILIGLYLDTLYINCTSITFMILSGIVILIITGGIILKEKFMKKFKN